MKRKIEKLAIANRGEIAVRIIRACQELNIKTVLLHSEVDANSLAYRLSDEQVCIGLAPSSESYLNIENIVNGALGSQADGVHPGFGFLSESAEFAQACQKSHLIFVGPSPESIRLFGDKISARELVESAGGRVIPGYSGGNQDVSFLINEVKKIGYPVMVKAAMGGGGRGLKVIADESQAEEMILSAKREGLSSFGSDKVFLEKYLGNAKHIEFQIFGDIGGNIFHLFERECSIQRKHQKVIEEALSPSLSFDLREKMSAMAISIAKEAKYLGAGTIEFLLDGEDYYFLEMNTRLQVEHPVTEMVLGVDLVKAQILTAMSKSTLWFQEELRPRGHAIECRIYAEDPYNQGLPSTGKILNTQWPHGPGRRFDIGFEAGDEITAFYDSMLAKVIVWDETRPRAIDKMISCLKETIIFGVKTNIDYLVQILSHSEFVSGSMNTHFIDKNFPMGLDSSELSQKEKDIIELICLELETSSQRNYDVCNTANYHLTSAWKK